jgi:F-type H+-transporting ATPase subunit b
MEIIPDPIHVALLTLPFLVAMAAMHVILWKPLLAWMDERDQLTSSARKEADDLDQAAADQLARIEERLIAARHDVHGVRADARARALAREAEIVAEAKARADAHVAEAVDKIRADRDAARGALQATAKDLSTEIAGRVLGRRVA